MSHCRRRLRAILGQFALLFCIGVLVTTVLGTTHLLLTFPGRLIPLIATVITGMFSGRCRLSIGRVLLLTRYWLFPRRGIIPTAALAGFDGQGRI